MSKSIKIDSNLWRRVEERAKEAGYSSPEELVEHALRRSWRAWRRLDARANRAPGERAWLPGMTGWSLMAIGFLSGAAMGLVFRRFTDLGALRMTGKRLLAHFAEFRLFFDEPWLIWRAREGADRRQSALVGAAPAARAAVTAARGVAFRRSGFHLWLETASGRQPRGGQCAVGRAARSRGARGAAGHCRRNTTGEERGGQPDQLARASATARMRQSAIHLGRRSAR